MTVSTTSIGTYTKRINVDNEVGLALFILELDTRLVAMGWAQHDIVSTYKRVYKTLNKDGSTYKYAILYINEESYYLYLFTCEDWNATTHTSTNEVGGNGYFPTTTGSATTSMWCKGSPIHLASDKMEFFINATGRHLFFMSVIDGDYTAWSAIFETERVAAEDTAENAHPCWFVVDSASSGISSTGTLLVGPPRVINNTTGVSNRSYLRTSAGVSGQGHFNQASLDTYGLHAWNTGKVIINTPWLSAPFAVTGATWNSGRLYSAKPTKKLGDPFNIVSLNVDADLFYVASGGTPTDHFIIPGLAGPSCSQNYSATQYTTTSSSAVACAPVVAQNFLFVGLANGTVDKFNLNDGTKTNLATNSGNISDMITDGVYVFVAGSTSSKRITVSNDTLYDMVLTSVAAFTLDATYVYACHTSTGTSVTIKRAARSAPNSWSTVGTITGLTASTSCVDIATDDYGNVWALTAVMNTAAAATPVIYKMKISDGTYVAMGGFGGASSGTWQMGGIACFDGEVVHAYMNNSASTGSVYFGAYSSLLPATDYTSSSGACTGWGAVTPTTTRVCTSSIIRGSMYLGNNTTTSNNVPFFYMSPGTGSCASTASTYNLPASNTTQYTTFLAGRLYCPNGGQVTLYKTSFSPSYTYGKTSQSAVGSMLLPR